jgi:hypothetical protein
MKKLFGFLFFLILLLAAALFVGKDWIAKVALASTVKALTGFETTVDTVRLDPFQGTVHVENLTLANPPQFEKRIFADIPEIHLSMDLPSLLKRERIRIYEMRLDIQELNIEKDPQGTSNVSLLTSSAPAKKAPSQEAPEAPKIPFLLDRFELTLRQVSYSDRSSLVPQKLSLDMKIDKEVFEGINDPKSIVNVILLKVVSRSPFGSFGLDPAQMQDALKGTIGKALELGEGVVSGETVQTTVTETKDTITEVGTVAKEKLTDLFGKLKSE